MMERMNPVSVTRDMSWTSVTKKRVKVSHHYLAVLKGTKEMFYLMMHSNILFIVIWHWTYGK